MARVPRYGIHGGIKYSPRRTLLRWCLICNNPFHPAKNVQKYCSEECLQESNRIKQLERNPEIHYNHNESTNAKWNPINNPKRDATEEERRKRINQWKVWYSNLTPEQRQKYNHKKKQGATKKEDTYQSVQDELKALGLR